MTALLCRLALAAASLLPVAATGADSALRHFGFTAVACGIDDPHDASNLTDYSAEVAGFTNLNQVCLVEDPAAFTAKLAAASELFDPLITVEPLFFTFAGVTSTLLPERDLLWPMFRDAIRASGVDPARIVFYLVDEPALRGLPITDVAVAARTIRADFPESRQMLVEAFDPAREPQIIPEIDLWGFDHYFLRDPAADPAYMVKLNLAAAKLAPHQQLVLVLDANHTDVHRHFGLLPDDMGDVARAYHRLAATRSDVAALLGYTWVSIDGSHESGARNMPPEVIETYRAIGAEITRPE